MPCYSPNVVARDKDGEIRFISGHHLRASPNFDINSSIIGGSNRAIAYRYHSHKFHATELFPIACKSCIGCRLYHSREWAIRCVHENQMSSHSCFATITYNSDSLPAHSSLVLSDMTNFFKRLRRKLDYSCSSLKFRYMYCGEYGDQTFRPHYHVLFFGLDFFDKKLLKNLSTGHPLFISDTLDDVWGKGHCFLGNVTFESSAYVARYINKKVNGPLAEEHYTVIDEMGEAYRRKSEYALSSRMKQDSNSLGGGLGASFFEKYHSDIYPSDEIIIKGKKMRPPSYYDKLLERLNPDLLLSVKEKRQSFLDELSFDDENSMKRLLAKEQVKLRQVSQLIRPL